MKSVDNLFNISGKVVAITGGGGILCSNIARALAIRGAKIAVLDIRREACESVVDKINKEGGEAIPVTANVLEKKSLEEAKKTILDRFNRVDILINGAGGNKKEATTSEELSFFDIPEDAIHFVFNLNFIGAFFPSQVFGKVLAEQKEGIILNISSMASLRPLTKVVGYSAAKSAINNFTQWLAVHISREYSPKIRVNAIAPGFFLTGQNRYLLIDLKTGEMTPRGRQIIDHTPMARYGNPDDLIGAVIWLISPASEFVHGAIIPVDGGFSAYSGV
ncbi:MAG TPA: SDR family oxidoreductase [Candidatus Omnitrophica bacterium]|nr:SDR family oxidoreductase [Candidatus Omnitrophota bacterium]